jgi:hypothetical protein
MPKTCAFHHKQPSHVTSGSARYNADGLEDSQRGGISLDAALQNKPLKHQNSIKLSTLSSTLYDAIRVVTLAKIALFLPRL